MKKILIAFIVLVLVSANGTQAKSVGSANYNVSVVNVLSENTNKANAGLYPHTDFESAFPNGLTIGCENTLTFTSAKNIVRFLPSNGQPVVLATSSMNPKSNLGDLAGQLVTLYLSVGFDSYDDDLTISEPSLAEFVIDEGTFKGWTVAKLLVEANNTFGGCTSNYSPSQLANALKSVNESNDNDRLIGNFLKYPNEDISSQKPGAKPVYPVIGKDGKLKTNVNKKNPEYYKLPKER